VIPLVPEGREIIVHGQPRRAMVPEPTPYQRLVNAKVADMLADLRRRAYDSYTP
jgi:hypothetical protein